MCKIVFLSMWSTGLIIRFDLYGMHLPLSRHIPGVAVVADMDPIQLALDSFPDKRLVFSICFCMDRPHMVGRSPSLA